MRYIPDTRGQTVVQVPDSTNAYINVKGFGARGIGDTEFVGNIGSVSSNEMVINSITDGAGKALTEYAEELSTGVQINAFVYRLASTPEEGILTVSSIETQGTNFSDSPTTSAFIAPLKYYVWGYDVEKGILPNSVQVVDVGSKILDPDRWNEDQYVELRFSRSNQYVIPIIYRVWGGQVEFLGGVGAEKIGYPGTSVVSFRDLGLSDVPSWNPDAEMPSFFKDVFTVSAGIPTQLLSVRGKETLEILPIPQGVQLTYIRLKPALEATFLSFNRYSGEDVIKFVIDDTKYIREAIEQARTTSAKELFFPSGVYNFRDTALINSSSRDYSSLTLRGVGESSMIRRMRSLVTQSSPPGLLSFSGQAPDNPVQSIRFRNICFDGNSTSNFSTQQSTLPLQSNEVLVSVENAFNISVSESVFKNSGGNGMYIKDSRDMIILGSIFSFSGRRYETGKSPLYVFQSQNLVAQGNIFELSTSNPTFFSTDFSTINNNIIRSCGDKGISLPSSYQWNATNNIAYSDNDSLILSLDQYNSEFFSATLEVTRGIPLSPVYFTVTNGGESVSIAKNSISAEIFNLGPSGNSTSKLGNFKVIETFDQREAGIFSITLPGTAQATVGGLTIPSTSQLDILDPQNQQFGYFYSIKASVKLGRGGKGFPPLSIRNLTIGGSNFTAVRLRSSSDLLSLQVYSATNPDNDKIIISGFSNTNLSGLNPNVGYTVVDIDSDSNSLLLNPISGLVLTNQPIEFIGGDLFILRSNYLIAQGNVLVH
jgi:hypothetical protein